MGTQARKRGWRVAQALERTVVSAASVTGTICTRPRRTRGALSAILRTLPLLGGEMIIWKVIAVLPHAGQRLAQEGHSRSHAPQNPCVLDSHGRTEGWF